MLGSHVEAALKELKRTDVDGLPAFLQVSDGSTIGSATPQSNGGDDGPGSERSVVGLGQMAIIIEQKGRTTMGGAKLKEETGHQGAMAG